MMKRGPTTSRRSSLHSVWRTGDWNSGDTVDDNNFRSRSSSKKTAKTIGLYSPSRLVSSGKVAQVSVSQNAAPW